MDKDILDCCKLEAIETEIEESEAIVARPRVINCRQKIELFIASTTTGGGVPPPTVSHAPLPPSTASHDPPLPSSIVPSKPRLPKLVLPKFKGDVKDWSAFWDSFKSAIHDNNDIPRWTSLII